MWISKTLTLTSKLIVLREDSMKNISKNQDFGLVKRHDETILVIEKPDFEKTNGNELLKVAHKLGVKLVISDNFSSGFSAKAINYGILTIEVSSLFLNKIITANNKSNIKLFVDIPGLEVMIVKSGEKEYFELSEYSIERYKNGKDDVENLHTVWNELNYSYTKEDVYECTIE